MNIEEQVELLMQGTEYGDEELKEACVNKFERAWGVKTAPTGSHCLDLVNASCLMNQAALTAALIRPGAYHRMVQKVCSPSLSLRLGCHLIALVGTV